MMIILWYIDRTLISNGNFCPFHRTVLTVNHVVAVKRQKAPVVAGRYNYLYYAWDASCHQIYHVH